MPPTTGPEGNSVPGTTPEAAQPAITEAPSKIIDQADVPKPAETAVEAPAPKMIDTATIPAGSAAPESKFGETQVAEPAAAPEVDTSDPSYAINKYKASAGPTIVNGTYGPKVPGVDLPESHESKARREAQYRASQGLPPLGQSAEAKSRGLINKMIGFFKRG